MSKCPKCGGKSGWERNVRVTGHVVEIGVWGNPHYHDISNDWIDYAETPKTVRCIDCGHRASPLTEARPDAS